MDDLRFNCPYCNQSLDAPEELFGLIVDCPTCGGRIAVPQPEITRAQSADEALPFAPKKAENTSEYMFTSTIPMQVGQTANFNPAIYVTLAKAEIDAVQLVIENLLDGKKETIDFRIGEVKTLGLLGRLGLVSAVKGQAVLGLCVSQNTRHPQSAEKKESDNRRVPGQSQNDLNARTNLTDRQSTLIRVLKDALHVARTMPDIEKEDENNKEIVMSDIAITLARAGSAAVAREVVESDCIRDRVTIMRDIAIVQASLGDTAGAFATTRLISGDSKCEWMKSEVLCYIALAQVQVSDTAATETLCQVLDTIRSIKINGDTDEERELKVKKAFILINIGKIQALLGGQISSSKIFQEALLAIPNGKARYKEDVFRRLAFEQMRSGDYAAALDTASTHDAVFKNASGGVLPIIAEAMIERGDIDLARKTVYSMRQSCHRVEDLVDICKIQSVIGDLEGAFATAKSINASQWAMRGRDRDAAFAIVAKAQADVGNHEMAVATARMIIYPFERVFALVDVAASRSGLPKEALAILDEAASCARSIKNRSETCRSFRKIAELFFNLGEGVVTSRLLNEALAVANIINDSCCRCWAINHIAEGQALCGLRDAASVNYAECIRVAISQMGIQNALSAVRQTGESQTRSGMLQRALETADKLIAPAKAAMYLGIGHGLLDEGSKPSPQICLCPPE